MTTTIGSDRVDRIEDKLDRLDDRLAAISQTTAALDELVGQIDMMRELVADVVPLAPGGMQSATQSLAELEHRGYFTFAKEGLGVVDRVVSSYDEADIRALADNVVLIVDTVKEMTQPEVLGMLSRTVHSMEETEETPPSLFKLAGQLRDPEVKRGLSRLMSLLKSMGQSVQEKEEK